MEVILTCYFKKNQILFEGWFSSPAYEYCCKVVLVTFLVHKYYK